MSSLKRFAATASAVALATGTTLAGAGMASAQDNGDEDTGSLSSSSLNLGDTAGDLETAAEALNGPVTVTPNEEGGPTVTYVNEADGDQRCAGFTAPYSTVIEEDLDTDYDPDELLAAIALIQALEGGGDVSLLDVDADGAPNAYEDPDPDSDSDVVELFLPLLAHPNEEEPDLTPGVVVGVGDEISWTAPTPGTPALTVVACIPEGGGELATYTGIDPQVVADQINGFIPGGSLALVSPDMISGGSVEMGAMALGSLAGGSDNGDEDPEPPVDPDE